MWDAEEDVEGAAAAGDPFDVDEEDADTSSSALLGAWGAEDSDADDAPPAARDAKRRRVAPPADAYGDALRVMLDAGGEHGQSADPAPPSEPPACSPRPLRLSRWSEECAGRIRDAFMIAAPEAHAMHCAIVQLHQQVNRTALAGAFPAAGSYIEFARGADDDLDLGAWFVILVLLPSPTRETLLPTTEALEDAQAALMQQIVVWVEAGGGTGRAIRVTPGCTRAVTVPSGLRVILHVPDAAHRAVLRCALRLAPSAEDAVASMLDAAMALRVCVAAPEDVAPEDVSAAVVRCVAGTVYTLDVGPLAVRRGAGVTHIATPAAAGTVLWALLVPAKSWGGSHRLFGAYRGMDVVRAPPSEWPRGAGRTWVPLGTITDWAVQPMGAAAPGTPPSPPLRTYTVARLLAAIDAASRVSPPTHAVVTSLGSSDAYVIVGLFSAQPTRMLAVACPAVRATGPPVVTSRLASGTVRMVPYEVTLPLRSPEDALAAAVLLQARRTTSPVGARGVALSIMSVRAGARAALPPALYPDRRAAGLGPTCGSQASGPQGVFAVGELLRHAAALATAAAERMVAAAALAAASPWTMRLCNTTLEYGGTVAPVALWGGVVDHASRAQLEHLRPDARLLALGSPAFLSSVTATPTERVFHPRVAAAAIQLLTARSGANFPDATGRGWAPAVEWGFTAAGVGRADVVMGLGHEVVTGGVLSGAAGCAAGGFVGVTRASDPTIVNAGEDFAVLCAATRDTARLAMLPPDVPLTPMTAPLAGRAPATRLQGLFATASPKPSVWVERLHALQLRITEAGLDDAPTAALRREAVIEAAAWSRATLDAAMAPIAAAARATTEHVVGRVIAGLAPLGDVDTVDVGHGRAYGSEYTGLRTVFTPPRTSTRRSLIAAATTVASATPAYEAIMRWRGTPPVVPSGASVRTGVLDLPPRASVAAASCDLVTELLPHWVWVTFNTATSMAAKVLPVIAFPDGTHGRVETLGLVLRAPNARVDVLNHNTTGWPAALPPPMDAGQAAACQAAARAVAHTLVAPAVIRGVTARATTIAATGTAWIYAMAVTLESAWIKRMNALRLPLEPPPSGESLARMLGVTFMQGAALAAEGRAAGAVGFVASAYVPHVIIETTVNNMGLVLGAFAAWAALFREPAMYGGRPGCDAHAAFAAAWAWINNLSALSGVADRMAAARVAPLAAETFLPLLALPVGTALPGDGARHALGVLQQCMSSYTHAATLLTGSFMVQEALFPASLARARDAIGDATSTSVVDVVAMEQTGDPAGSPAAVFSALRGGLPLEAAAAVTVALCGAATATTACDLSVPAPPSVAPDAVATLRAAPEFTLYNLCGGIESPSAIVRYWQHIEARGAVARPYRERRVASMAVLEAARGAIEAAAPRLHAYYAPDRMLVSTVLRAGVTTAAFAAPMPPSVIDHRMICASAQTVHTVVGNALAAFPVMWATTFGATRTFVCHAPVLRPGVGLDAPAVRCLLNMTMDHFPPHARVAAVRVSATGIASVVVELAPPLDAWYPAATRALPPSESADAGCFTAASTDEVSESLSRLTLTRIASASRSPSRVSFAPTADGAPVRLQVPALNTRLGSRMLEVSWVPIERVSFAASVEASVVRRPRTLDVPVVFVGAPHRGEAVPLLGTPVVQNVVYLSLVAPVRSRACVGARIALLLTRTQAHRNSSVSPAALVEVLAAGQDAFMSRAVGAYVSAGETWFTQQVRQPIEAALHRHGDAWAPVDDIKTYMDACGNGNAAAFMALFMEYAQARALCLVNAVLRVDPALFVAACGRMPVTLVVGGEELQFTSSSPTDLHARSRATASLVEVPPPAEWLLDAVATAPPRCSLVGLESFTGLAWPAFIAMMLMDDATGETPFVPILLPMVEASLDRARADATGAQWASRVVPLATGVDVVLLVGPWRVVPDGAFDATAAALIRAAAAVLEMASCEPGGLLRQLRTILSATPHAWLELEDAVRGAWPRGSPASVVFAGFVGEGSHVRVLAHSGGSPVPPVTALLATTRARESDEAWTVFHRELNPDDVLDVSGAHVLVVTPSAVPREAVSGLMRTLVTEGGTSRLVAQGIHVACASTSAAWAPVDAVTSVHEPSPPAVERPPAAPPTRPGSVPLSSHAPPAPTVARSPDRTPRASPSTVHVLARACTGLQLPTAGPLLALEDNTAWGSMRKLWPDAPDTLMCRWVDA